MFCRVEPHDRVMAKHIEDLGQFLQSFGVAPLALLFLPVLITALARNATLALATSLLSFTSLMLFVAPASAINGLAIVSGLGSFLVALESIVARGRMMALNKEIADLTSRVNQLERAEQRRLTLEIKARPRSDHHGPSPSHGGATPRGWRRPNAQNFVLDNKKQIDPPSSPVSR